MVGVQSDAVKTAGIDRETVHGVMRRILCSSGPRSIRTYAASLHGPLTQIVKIRFDGGPQLELVKDDLEARTLR